MNKRIPNHLRTSRRAIKFLKLGEKVHEKYENKFPGAIDELWIRWIEDRRVHSDADEDDLDMLIDFYAGLVDKHPDICRYKHTLLYAFPCYDIVWVRGRKEWSDSEEDFEYEKSCKL